ncbi:MAG: glycosyltransferase [Terrimicrobiaceae bacterium]|nr:glycosyltransferase [Terrimicrobiaceae bacterium]
MSRPPAITVLMACRNGGAFLEPALESIASQVFRDWEMVVGDAAGDGSPEILEAWARREPRLRLLRNSSNLGQTASLNLGLAKARGRWIERQDADDLSHPLRLLRQWEAVTAFPDLDLLGTAGRMIDANGRLRGLLDVPASHNLINRAACFLNPFLHTSVLFRTETLRDRLGGYNERFAIAQDYELWNRLLASGRCANLQARLVAYRHLGGSLSKAGRNQAFAEAAIAARRHADSAFPGLLDEQDHQALTAFREGTLEPRTLPALALAWKKLRLDAEPGGSRYLAALRLRAAGTLASRSKSSALRLVLGALLRSPAFTSSWLAERARG